jgi:hypothetical protein
MTRNVRSTLPQPLSRSAAPAIILTLTLLQAGCDDRAHSWDQAGRQQEQILGHGADGAALAGSIDLATAPPALPYAQGGQRLKAEHLTAEGVALFTRFHDQQLDVGCTWFPASDADELRCLPDRRADVVYLDRECKQPVAPASTSQWTAGTFFPQASVAPGAFVIGDVSTPSNDECKASVVRRKAYRVGAKAVSGHPDNLIAGRLGLYGCNGARDGRRFIYLVDLYHLEPVPEQTFVRGQRTRVSAGEGLAVSRVVGDDGSAQTLGVRDADGAPCQLFADGACVSGTLTTAKAGRRDALDPSQPPTFFYADAACQTELFRSTFLRTCALPEFGVVVREGQTRVFTLAPASKGYQRTADGTCSAIDGFIGDLLAPRDDVTATIPIARTVRRGSGVLFLDQFSGDDAERFVPVERGRSFVDARGRPCTVMQAADQTLRCVPDRWKIEEASYWRDPACRERLFVSLPMDADLTDLVVMDGQDMYRPPTIRGLSSVEVHTGPVYRSQSQACREVARPDAQRLLTRGASIPLTVLPQVEVARR